jgi:hypothetical protein
MYVCMAVYMYGCVYIWVCICRQPTRTKYHLQDKYNYRLVVIGLVITNSSWNVSFDLNVQCEEYNQLLLSTISDQRVDLCLNNPCLNGATCSSDGSRIACACAFGYSGSLCELGTGSCIINIMILVCYLLL